MSLQIFFILILSFFLADRTSQKRLPHVASRGQAKGTLTTSDRNRQKQIFAWGTSQLYQHFQPLGKSHKKSSFFVSHQLTTNINNKDALSGLRPGLEVASLRMKGSLVPGRDATIFKNSFFCQKRRKIVTPFVLHFQNP